MTPPDWKQCTEEELWHYTPLSACYEGVTGITKRDRLSRSHQPGFSRHRVKFKSAANVTHARYGANNHPAVLLTR